ncbi:hypothetical protein RI367_003067 [Sorochytrium milnesiophthora]
MDGRGGSSHDVNADYAATVSTKNGMLRPLQPAVHPALRAIAPRPPASAFLFSTPPGVFYSSPPFPHQQQQQHMYAPAATVMPTAHLFNPQMTLQQGMQAAQTLWTPVFASTPALAPPQQPSIFQLPTYQQAPPVAMQPSVPVVRPPSSAQSPDAAMLKRKRTKHTERDPNQPPLATQPSYSLSSASTKSEVGSRPAPKKPAHKSPSKPATSSSPPTTTPAAPPAAASKSKASKATITRLKPGDVILLNEPSPCFSLDGGESASHQCDFTLAMCMDDVSFSATNADAKVPYRRLLAYNMHDTSEAPSEDAADDSLTPLLEQAVNRANEETQANTKDAHVCIALASHHVFVVEDIKRHNRSRSLIPDLDHRIWILRPRYVHVAIGGSARTVAFVPKGDVVEAQHLCSRWVPVAEAAENKEQEVVS